jgi:glycosyltransferase involved in cell wall biosynthesis
MFFQWFQRQFQSQQRLVILDDIFPHLLSAFRVAEYNAYLETFPNAVVYSTAATFPMIAETRSLPEVIHEYEQHYPSLKGRVLPMDVGAKLTAGLIYMIFINNAFTFIDAIEQSQIPFIFTLYPGGGLQLDDEICDAKLSRVCASPYLRKVITTQKITHHYLLDRQFCRADQVELIYGGVLPTEKLTQNMPKRKRYLREKQTFDICFVAYKYIEKGVDKGYDLFLEVAHQLVLTGANDGSDVRFHVVGNFDESDIDVSQIRHKIHFYGTQHTNFFPQFYAEMDLILSPNVPFVFRAGGFDGFPTGSCAEAGLSGVAVFCTDLLEQNPGFKDRQEIVIISRDVQEITQIVSDYYHNPEQLYKLAKKGKQAFQKAFQPRSQIAPRLKLLSESLQQISSE